MPNRFDKKSTLFISDFDGTLLNKSAEITPPTRETLIQLLSAGYNFTIATARMAKSVENLLDGIPVALPVVVMNGAMVYDASTRKYLKVFTLPGSAVSAIVAAARANEVDVLMYRMDDGSVDVTRYFATADNKRLSDVFMDEILKTRRKIDRQVLGLDSIESEGDICYFTFADTREKLLPVYEAVTKIDGVAVVMSKDDYTNGWFLECFSSEASKANATAWLREKFGFEYIVAFGDNMNDIEFIAEADEGYAPENAVPEAKDVAKAIIASNADDGVAKWIRENVLEA